MKPSGAHTHPDGGGGLALLIVAIAVVVAAVAGPVIHAAADLVRLALIVAAVMAGVVVAGAVGYVAWRCSRGRRTQAASARPVSTSHPPA